VSPVDTAGSTSEKMKSPKRPGSIFPAYVEPTVGKFAAETLRSGNLPAVAKFAMAW